ncbi:MAG: hypothetical protein WD359_00610 [Dehalococcoidia bacterium]
MPLHPLARRITFGAALAAAGLTMLFARPDAALAHHIETDEDYACDGWTVRAEYIGGNGDRMVVVDVTVNGEHIDETFIFDDDHLGHQDYYLLYERSGTGSLQTSGTITMYERGRRGYTIEAGTDGTDIDLVCAAPTSTATKTATATPSTTNTPVPTATSTPEPEDTPETEGSVTPLPAETATPDITVNSTITPLPTEPPTEATQTPVGTSSRNRTTSTATATAAIATPTFTDEVQGGTPPAQPSAPDAPSGGEGDTPETGTSFPDAGEGGMDGVSFIVAMLGFGLVIVGIATVVGGRSLRPRK